MILAPCNCTLQKIIKHEKYFSVYLACEDKEFLSAPIDGTLMRLENATNIVCRIKSDIRDITIIKYHRGENLGKSRRIPQNINSMDSMSVPVNIFDLIEMRLPSDNLLIMRKNYDYIEKGELIGIYLPRSRLLSNVSFSSF